MLQLAQRDVNVLTDRVQVLRERMRATTPHASAEKCRLYTQAWKENESQPLDIRYAKMFEKFLTEGAVSIRNDELIVGSQSEYLIGAAPFLEYYSDGAANELKRDKFGLRGEKESADITEGERHSLLEAIQYWEVNSVRAKLVHKWRDIFGEERIREILRSRVLVIPENRPLLLGDLDFQKVLDKGLKGVIAEAEDEKVRLTYTNADDLQRYQFLQAAIISLKAVIAFSHRYADLARQLAEKEGDGLRRQELEEIASVCDLVPEHPARSFREAVQSLWFVYLCAFLESACTIGRWDQYLYPFYKRDFEEGRITRGEAAEILACLWIKFNEITVFQSAFSKEATQGSLLQYLTIGGVTRDGRDATNEISHLILEVARQLKLTQPSVAVSWHPDISEDLLLKAIETNRDIGGGIPAFLNGSLSTEKFVNDYGFDPKDAWDVYYYGCVHPSISGKTQDLGACSINTPKVFELALNNGVDPATGKQLGPATGDPRTFKSIEEVFAAFESQFEYWIDMANRLYNVYILNKTEHCRVPFRSALTDSCLARGRDVFRSGAQYSQYSGSFNVRCGQNIANSLLSIKKLVFDEKKIDMSDVLAALKSNFEGNEELRQLLVSQPKWGNDDDEVDAVYQRVWDRTGQICQHSGFLPWTRENLPAMVWRGGATWHYVSGKTCGAFPDGRKAAEPMADATVSPSAGTDVKGPTAAMNSALKLNPRATLSTLFNMKFPPHLLKSDDGKRKLLQLIQTYFKRGGYHVQFNMISRETLLDAKAHPENYRDLVVRIAGFSAYFVDLVESVQDDIISRTELPL